MKGLVNKITKIGIFLFDYADWTLDSSDANFFALASDRKIRYLN